MLYNALGTPLSLQHTHFDQKLVSTTSERTHFKHILLLDSIYKLGYTDP